jgi:hypothetical protein
MDTRIWLVIAATAAMFAVWLAANVFFVLAPELARARGRSHAAIAGARRSRSGPADALVFADERVAPTVCRVLATLLTYSNSQ